ncbi:glycosyltransferase family 76 protein [Dendrothele bispora CBS 962.96]|uniref:GPI mannosyltransferase 2 n=1 Tax=Dendrothele bispora (strain CBS 962.96) TaxID=1314807 RepID=A0A4S8MF37_DENBC|nr:glycosyltransferase family 76 protein [Dendrothele bispora CBS 962.96]
MDDHQKSLYFLTFLSRVLVFLIVYSTAYLVPSFDSSHKTLGFITSKWSEPLLRWDTFHFLHIAQEGYIYEHEWAFFPGAPLVMRYTGYLAGMLWRKSPDLLATGALAALACDTTQTLYLLALHHLQSKKLAYLAAILSLMSSSPATLRLTPYTEPFFTYFSYRGMLYCTKERWFYASICFALASLFRSNGIMLSGYILWGLIIVPLLGTKMIPWKNIPRSVLYTSMILSPFIYHQCTAYLTFCILPLSSPTLFPNPHSIPQWCNHTFPSIYTHAQKTYWDVGLLRYWTPQQIPNFLLAVPPLGCLLAFCYYILSRSPQLISQMMQQPSAEPRNKSNDQNPSSSPFLNPTLLPHAIHAFIFSLLILFNSHVQIILRVGPSLPFLYFGAAWLVMGDSNEKRGWKWGKMWVGWSLVWGVLSCVFWAAGLPPA